MDVTQQVNRQMITSGGGSSRPEYFAVNRSLDRSKGSNSLINADTQRVTAIPYSVSFKDTVGLFGAENIFIKVQLDVQNSLDLTEGGIEIDGYTELTISSDRNTDIYWDEAVRDYSKDLLPIENTFEPAEFSNDLNYNLRPLVRIDLNNLKTGNKYIDAWFDVRHKPNKEEHPYDVMYINPKGYFYIGFHARNTKRLPYNVSMTVDGKLFSEFDLKPEEKRLLASSQ